MKKKLFIKEGVLTILTLALFSILAFSSDGGADSNKKGERKFSLNIFQK